MPSTWQKMMFFLGLVDEEQMQAAAAEETASPTQAQAQVRTVEPGSQRRVPQAPPTDAPGPAPRPEVAGKRVEPPATQRRRISANRSHAEAGVLVRPPGEPQPLGRPVAGDTSEPFSEVVVAKTFSDAQRLADSIRASVPVVLDLRSTEPEMVRRLVDFASGLTYALDGSMRKIAQGVILVTPPRVTVSEQELRRLAEAGLHAQPGGDG